MTFNKQKLQNKQIPIKGERAFIYQHNMYITANNNNLRNNMDSILNATGIYNALNKFYQC